jgi:hypothetical protein
VGDHQDPEAAAAEAVEELEDPGPHGHVEHRHRLVGDEELGLEHERRGDSDPLALATRELVRITVEEELGRGELDPRERVAYERRPLRLRAPELVDEERLLDGGAHGEPRIERLVRILVDDLHPPAERPERAGAECGDVAALEANRVGDRVDQPQHGLRRRRLPAAGLADESDELAGADLERDAVDRVHVEARPSLPLSGTGVRRA